MNSTNITNATHNNVTNATTVNKNPWEESGAMVYVALTVATFSAVTMCCVWFFKQRWLKTTNYGTVNNDEEDIELTGEQDSSSEEEIPLDNYKDDPQKSESTTETDSRVFTLDDSGSDEEKGPEHQDAEHMDSV
jgi:hypothetical protein